MERIATAAAASTTTTSFDPLQHTKDLTFDSNHHQQQQHHHHANTKQCNLKMSLSFGVILLLMIMVFAFFMSQNLPTNSTFDFSGVPLCEDAVNNKTSAFVPFYMTKSLCLSNCSDGDIFCLPMAHGTYACIANLISLEPRQLFNPCDGVHMCRQERECIPNITDTILQTSLWGFDDVILPYICGPCPLGWEEDGAFGCKDKNECLDPEINHCIWGNRTCVNHGMGMGYECGTCGPGLVESGAFMCRDIDECILCPDGKTCENTWGSYICV